MKTVFVTSFYPLISRNILETDFLKNLTAKGDVRAVILAPLYKKEYFVKSFSSPQVVVEGIAHGQPTKTLRGLVLKRLSKLMLPTRTVRLQQKTKLYAEKNLFRFYVLYMPVRFAGRFGLFRKLLRLTSYHLAPRGIFDELIEKYNPDAIFSTDIQNENDVNLMQEARRRGISVLGMVRSWDNLTVHGIMQILPDKLLATSVISKDAAIKYHDMPADDIFVVGIAHYDNYLKGPTLSKEDFSKKFGTDRSKKLILYAPVGDRYIYKNDMDKYVLEALSSADAHVLVRFPPTDTVSLGDFKKPKNMAYHQPGKNFKDGFLLDQEIGREDDESLINSLYWSDLVICGPSTLGIDAALFGKPVIFVNFYPTERVLWEKAVGIHFNHIDQLLKVGGIKVADTREQFMNYIKEYLENPKLDEDARKKIVEKWCAGGDGKST